jgi:hypothetical protein
MIIDFCVKITTAAIQWLNYGGPLRAILLLRSGHKFSRLSNTKIGFSREASDGAQLLVLRNLICGRFHQEKNVSLLSLLLIFSCHSSSRARLLL